MRVLGISGSLRRGSHNSELLRAAAALLAPGVEFELWDDLKAIPPFDEDDEALGEPAPVIALKAAIAGADALVISTPEYNASVPGQLKNAIDWVSRPVVTQPFRGTPTLVIGASTGMFGAVWSQAELRRILEHLGATLIDAELPVGLAADGWGAEVEERLGGLLALLLEECQVGLEALRVGD